LINFNTKSEKELLKSNKKCSADDLKPVKLNVTTEHPKCADNSDPHSNQKFTPVSNISPIKYAGEHEVPTKPAYVEPRETKTVAAKTTSITPKQPTTTAVNAVKPVANITNIAKPKQPTFDLGPVHAQQSTVGSMIQLEA